jgi:pteridine reductase
MTTEQNKPAPVALLTGSGRKRVGNVVAQHLSRCGYRIALHYHTAEADAETTCTELRSSGVDCRAFEADVSDEQEVESLIEQTLEHFGRIDVVVTTSSIWQPTPLEKLSATDLRKNFDVNTLGTFLVARAAGLKMVEQDSGGSVITVGDWAIERPYIDHAAYFVSKGAIPTLTRVLAVELGHRNPKVRVNCIHPGPVMFPPNATDEHRQQLRDSTLVKDGDCPETVAHAVQFLIENRFITGACIPIDGGRHMHAPSELHRE